MTTTIDQIRSIEADMILVEEIRCLSRKRRRRPLGVWTARPSVVFHRTRGGVGSVGKLRRKTHG